MNDEGYSSAQRRRYFELAERASELYGGPSQLAGYGAQTLGMSLNNGLSLFGSPLSFRAIAERAGWSGAAWQLRWVGNLMTAVGRPRSSPNGAWRGASPHSCSPRSLTAPARPSFVP